MISVKDNIIDSVIWGLKQITTAAGYNNTILNVYDPPTEFNSMREFPCVNIFEGDDSCENATSNAHEQTGGNQCKLFNSMTLQLDCVISDINTPRKSLNKILADIQKYFGLHWVIPDSSGDASAFNCLYAGSTTWGVDSTIPLVGISIRLKIWYDQQLTDPALRG